MSAPSREEFEVRARKLFMENGGKHSDNVATAWRLYQEFSGLITGAPRAALTVIRPDEVAECWNGVLAVAGLYEALWDLVPRYTGPKPEVAEELTYGTDSVALFWGRLSDYHKAALNRLALENE